ASEDVSALVAKAGAASVSAAQEKEALATSATQAPAPVSPPAPSAAPPTTPARAATAPSPGLAPTESQAARPAEARLSDTMAPPAQRRPPVVNVLDRAAYAAEGAVASEPERPRNGGADGARVRASPYVRKVARERGIDLQGAQGTGPGGRLVPADLDSMRTQGSAALARIAPAASQIAPVPGSTGSEPPEVRPLSPMRKTIARRLTESKQTVPHFYLSIDVDAAAFVRLREHINAELASSGRATNGSDASAAAPAKVSLNDLLIKACAIALVHVPECNASFTSDAILVHKRVDISVAVAIPDGLVTPVIRRADQKSVVAIAREVRELAGRARARKLKPEEMQDGTFSISNLGMFGVDSFAAVINPPEGAILAAGQVRDEPVVVDGDVVAGKRMTLTLSCDHRVVDGAVGAAFLAELRRLIEHPMRVLTG
ncbi:MAG: 2-oxo acid dehydrogenase subunit E2, partial [Myxococcota bacterium]|nr:2-oxo acid dehydrogenase subunit E2 [Myxococcota bacterium]